MKWHPSLLIMILFGLFTNSLWEIALFFGCILFHEAGHLFFIILFKQKVKCLNLHLLGGQVDCEIKNTTLIQNLLINLGGIIVNFLIIKFSFLIPSYQHLLISYNKILIIVNLIPIYPLDGYRIIENIIGLIKSPSLEFSIVSYASFLCLLGLFLYGVLKQALIIIIACLFLGYKNSKRIKAKDQYVLQKILTIIS